MTAPSQVFDLQPPFSPAGDQPDAIAALCRGLDEGSRFQVLEGVTGSGKTFTMANVIAHYGRPTLVLSHNKTLVAQLYSELKGFFPNNAVEYFVSYYDYYQPEAYIPQTDTFIEKDASINKEIERLRLSATNSLVSRDDVVLVASVSCIYGLGSPEDYREMTVEIRVGSEMDRDELLASLVDIQYGRNDYESDPGTFRVRGDTVDIFPSYSNHGVRVEMFGDEIERLQRFDTVTGAALAEIGVAVISPARHFVMPAEKIAASIDDILAEMDDRVAWFEARNKLLEAQRLKMRTMYDIEMLREVGFCAGIENYSRHLSGRAEGETPSTLLDYFPEDFLAIVDESHVTLPQVRGMYNGDRSRKETLIEHGFRLPSAKDNRPLMFDEFLAKTGPMVFTSATPSEYERQVSPPAVQQVVRPTGLVEPEVEVRPLKGQIDDLMHEVRVRAERGERALVTTLTKRTAEDLTDYLKSSGLRVEYMHSDIDAVERVEILRRLRQADFDCLVGINLLREGLDLPEVTLVAVLDADKEGFLRSRTALIQTAGRAARNVAGRVILYADTVTESMRNMIDVTTERRRRQLDYNEVHGITPRTVTSRLHEALSPGYKTVEDTVQSVVRDSGLPYDVEEVLHELEEEMVEASNALEFERAVVLRDQIQDLRRQNGLGEYPLAGSLGKKAGKGRKRRGKVGRSARG